MNLPEPRKRGVPVVCPKCDEGMIVDLWDGQGSVTVECPRCGAEITATEKEARVCKDRICEHAEKCDRLNSDGELCRHGQPHEWDQGCEIECRSKQPFGSKCIITEREKEST